MNWVAPGLALIGRLKLTRKARAKRSTKQRVVGLETERLPENPSILKNAL